MVNTSNRASFAHFAGAGAATQATIDQVFLNAVERRPKVIGSILDTLRGENLGFGDRGWGHVGVIFQSQRSVGKCLLFARVGVVSENGK